MTKAELRALLKDISGVRVALLGHFCLDAYWFLDRERGEISVETGLKVRSIREQRYAPGGAGNIAANLAALGCGKIHALGVVGRDLWAPELLRQLGGIGIDVSGLIVQETEWATQVFVKPHVDGRERNRFDTADLNRLLPETRKRLLGRLGELLREVDAVVINQQSGEGLHRASMRKALAALMAAHTRSLFVVDTRDYGDAYLKASLKLNEKEAVRAAGMKGCSVKTVRKAALALHARSRKPVFVTMGAAGCLGCDEGGAFEVPPVKVRGKTDPVGAGDSMLAGIVLALAAGWDPRTAAELGTLAAAVTVRKLRQTGTASPAEVMRLLSC